MNCDKNMSVGDGTVMAEDKIVFTGCKHAYLVMAHKDDETLRTLLRTLDDPRNDIFIHMDAKNTGWDENRALASIDKAGIFFVPRISVTWGGYSQIACELGLLNAAVDKGALHLLSPFERARPSHQEPGSDPFFLRFLRGQGVCSFRKPQ